ncbi:MAG: bifunctional demethylmenaquinone methyltransferase/2-methoxy-6-polyprenyl-1,4-benzoquinol methylase UbiE [Muribaculaceae bacterium]|nr:bifunctional demethylmenaquinone methyltransferase/2-methoxy-6-polyprenyl-1,4-benzoquinol methylase UbiE [Muribaculaceae bacterium]
MTDNTDNRKKTALTGAELVNPYDATREKADQVEEMFDSIAPAYDFMNTAMTFGLHRIWRARALDASTRALNRNACIRILDIATGTGDVAFDLHRRFPDACVTGIDLSEGMLAIAGKKLKNLDESAQKHISFERGDSLRMRFDDNSFDLITVAYGVRNFQHLDRGLAEMARVLRPGGTLCVIELSEPASTPVRGLYRLYSRHIIPAIGRMVSGDSRAYSYLPESIAAAPQRDKMTSLMKAAGLAGCRWRSMTFGAVTYYICTKK